MGVTWAERAVDKMVPSLNIHGAYIHGITWISIWRKD